MARRWASHQSQRRSGPESSTQRRHLYWRGVPSTVSLRRALHIRQILLVSSNDGAALVLH